MILSNILVKFPFLVEFNMKTIHFDENKTFFQNFKTTQEF